MDQRRLFEDPRTLLKRYGLHAKKSWGQNFLVSEKAVKVIAESCTENPGELVIEIGAGLGTLTSALLTLGANVVAIERDPEMCLVLKEEFATKPNFALRETDAASFDFAACMGAQRGVIAGNLPYQITGQILRNVLESNTPMTKAVFMVQKEVAERICAGPQNRERGALSVIVDARCSARIIHRLKPTAFHPPPKVHSAVIELTPRPTPLFGEMNPTHFNSTVKAAFATRRKTIRNSLITSGFIKASDIDSILKSANINPQLRAEKLTTVEFVALATASQL